MNIVNKIKGMNKWKLVALSMVLIFILILTWGYVSHQGHKVPLTAEQKERAVDVAKDALKNELTGNYTIDVGKTCREMGKKFGENKNRRVAYVFFAMENRTFVVVVDMDEWKAVQITENRGWMAKLRTEKRWRH